MALATADQLKTFNQRIANGHTGQNYMNKNNFYVGSSADNATAANQKQLNEYYRRVRAGHNGQQYLTKNNIYIGNRDTGTANTGTANNGTTTPGGMNQDYYDMVYGYEIPKQDTSYQDTYRNDMNNINYTPTQIQDNWSNDYRNAMGNVRSNYAKDMGNVDYNASKINDQYYNDYKNSLQNISGLANVDTLYDWRRNQATDAAQKYMASLGLSGSGAEAQAVTDAVNKVTAEDAQRYENLYMQEAQRQTDAANQLAQQGYNLYNANANYENAMNQLRAQNQSQMARDLAGYDSTAAANLMNAASNMASANAQLQSTADQARWDNQANMAANIAGFNNSAAANYQNLLAQQAFNNANNYFNMTENQTNRDMQIKQNNVQNLLSRYQMLLNASAAGVDVAKEMSRVKAQLASALA